MGNNSSSGAFLESVQKLGNYNHVKARKILDVYWELDMEFGISSNDLKKLFEKCNMDSDDELITNIMKCFPNASTLNALDFIEGFNCLCKGDLNEKLSIAFDTFDFQKKGEISFDEMTIMLMSVARGIKFLSTDAIEEVEDDIIATMIRENFGLVEGAEGDITKDQFTAWYKEKALKEMNALNIIKIINGAALVQEKPKIAALVETKADADSQESKEGEAEGDNSEGEAKPAEEEAKPAEEETKPAEEEAKPSEEEAKPSEEEAKPAEEEAKPAEEEAKPVEAATTADDQQQQVMDDDQQIVIPDEKTE